MAGGWFESVAEAQRRAKRRLPESVYMAIWAGSEHGLTLKDNVEAFGELGFAPHVAGLVDQRDLSTTVMGQPVSMPVLISPTGVQAVHPDGEVAVARAAAARGTAMGLSSFASKPVEEVVAAHPQTFFQLYWAGSREQLSQRMPPREGRGRGRADRHLGLVVLARPRLGQPRDPGPARPQDDGQVRPAGAVASADGSTAGRAPGARRSSPCRTWARPASPRRGSSASTASGCRRRCRPGRTCAGCARQWDGPMMLKGVMRVDDARLGGRDRVRRALGLQPRRQQPRRHARLDPRAAGHRRRRRRPDRGPARRRHPARQRRRQGARARCPGGHDRPSLSVGPRGQRPVRRRERPRRPALRDRLGPARARPRFGPRRSARPTCSSRRVSSAASAWPRRSRAERP